MEEQAEVEITSEKRKEYEQIREEFHKKRDNISRVISIIQNEIRKDEQDIGKLEKEIDSIRPRTEHGEKICEKCDVISMKYTHPQPGQSESYRWYKCEICGHCKYWT